MPRSYRYLPSLLAVAVLASALAFSPLGAASALAVEPRPRDFPVLGLAYVAAAVVLYVAIACRGMAARWVERHTRKLALLALGGAMLGLAACAGSSLASDPAVPLAIAKAEYGFEEAYNVAANAYLGAVQAGLPAATKAKVKPLLQQAYGLVLVARSAQTAGNAQGVQAQTAAINALVSQILQALPPPPATAGAQPFRR